MAREPRHGTLTEYRYGCRCDECRLALRTYKQARRASASAAAIDYCDDCGVSVDLHPEDVDRHTACGIATRKAESGWQQDHAPDEWDATLASAITGDHEDFSYLDDDAEATRGRR